MRDGGFWRPGDGRHGLWDVWSFRGLGALVSSGLGGGSLIYANVMLRAGDETFAGDEDARWPVSAADLAPHYAAVEAMQGATPYPADREPYASTPKTTALLGASERLGLDAFRPNLAVSFAPAGGRRALRSRTPERPRRPPSRLPPVRRVHRRLPVRREEHARLHVPQRGARRRRDDPLLLRGDAARARRRRRVALRLPPAPGGEGRAPGRPARPDRRARARGPRGAVVLAAGTFGSTRLLLPTGRACRG